jgi:pyrimidine operon attenuation protein/uracil phosphoribosyltransferase
MSVGTVLMNAEEIDRALARLAHQIMEVAGESGGVVLVGIHTRGVPLARRLARKIAAAGREEPAVGILDINLYRDDLSQTFDHPIVRRTEVPLPLSGKRIVLVDDVLYTGRTIRAAMDALTDLGRPRAVKLAVLIDRGGRELPIHADFVGRTFMVGPDQLVDVQLGETDGTNDRVVLRTHEPKHPRKAETAALPAAAKVRPGAAKKAKRAPGPKPAPRGKLPPGRRRKAARKGAGR